jgi:hypothetical protein
LRSSNVAEVSVAVGAVRVPSVGAVSPTRLAAATRPLAETTRASAAPQARRVERRRDNIDIRSSPPDCELARRDGERMKADRVSKR